MKKATSKSRKSSSKSKSSPKVVANARLRVPAKPASAGRDDWRAETLARVRRLIHEAAPDIVEERKWVKPTNPLGVPVWSHEGIICTGETYKSVVKLTFAKGASLEDPSRLFNSSLEGNVRRAIDIRETDEIDEVALKDLVRAAVALNLESPSRRPGRRS